jgi:hypothetical protein
MMMSALFVATVPIATIGDADVINVGRCCARSKIKRCVSSLNSRARLVGMDAGDSI